MTQNAATWLPLVFFSPLIAFTLYRRLSKTFRRQPVAPKRMALRMLLLSAVAVLLLVSMPSAAAFAAAALGGALGVVLAAFSLAHTRFEMTADGPFYTANKWFGVLVMALVLGRLAERLFAVYEDRVLIAAGALPDSALHRSPLTLGFFFLMAAYYVAYYAGVLRKGRTLGPAMTPLS